MTRTWPKIASVAVVLALMFTVSRGGDAAPETVPYVDLDRYLGTWYEIAKLPNFFQRHCAGNTTAQYRRLEDGQIEVVNRCRDKNVALDEASGIARVIDEQTNAKLEVSFFSLLGWRPFWGDYWILDLADDYRYAVVGSPDLRYGWVLSRTPTLPRATREVIDQRLRELGYDPQKFEDTPQPVRP